MRIFSYVLALVAAGLIAGSAVAQPPGGGGGRGGMQGGMRGMMGGAGTALLANASVAEELKLTDAQKEKLKTLTEGQRTKMREAMEKAREGGEFDREAFAKVMKEASEAGEKAVKEVLNADQQKRFQQIKWQQAGVAALAEEQVQKMLKITDEQKEKLKTIADDMGKDLRELMRDAQGNFEGMRPKMEALRTEAQDKAEGVLTADQKKEWKASLGTAFKIKEDPNAPRPGGGEGRPTGKGNRGGKGGEKGGATKKPKTDD